MLALVLITVILLLRVRKSRPLPPRVDPVAVVLIEREGVNRATLDAVMRHPRFEVLTTRSLTPEWLMLAQRAAGFSLQPLRIPSVAWTTGRFTAEDAVNAED